MLNVPHYGIYTNYNLFSVPKTCLEYKQKGATESGNYEIDPDGDESWPPFLVYCNLNKGNFSYAYKLNRIIISVVYVSTIANPHSICLISNDYIICR